ncbi:Histone-lysine N-methyltransferase Smyd1 [Smittium mucronatum]|uniref:Histone-lysine N-methyltransferase Smyd1 n=1 Tax=Smittium mucronatum TaxID=133383 RepID=A0A1R0H648_9FUNG|nr:Histone-lysine N-methyltransferase Smyd1 [Smittium mucronatum]
MTTSAQQAIPEAQAPIDSISKNKKKSKKQSKPCNYLDCERIHPIQFKNTLARGKHIIALSDIKAGSEILVEKSPLFIVRTNASNNVCHVCLKPAPSTEVDQLQLDADGNPVKNTSVKVKVPVHRCPDCNFSTYCSEQCFNDDSIIHKLECDGLKKLLALGQSQKFDLDKLRSVLKVTAKASIDEYSQNTQFVAGGKTETPFKFIDDIPNHRESFDKEWLDSTSEELKNIQLPSPFVSNSKTISEMLNQACRYQSSSYPFHDSTFRGVNDAFGIFPMITSYIKHSCSPNSVAISNQGPVLSIRSIVDIPKGSEINISLTELYQPREHRRRDLLLNKHFWCKCRRCSSPLSKSVDQYMDGIVCSKCHLGLMIFEETKEVDDVNELMKNTSLLDEEIMGKFASCNSCSNKIPVSELVDILRSAIESFSAAFMQYRQRNIEVARKLFEEYLIKFEKSNILHPYNSYIVNSLIPLMHCCRSMKDIGSSIQYCQKAIDQMSKSGAFSLNYPDITELRVTLGELLIEQANSKFSQNGTRSITTRNLCKKLFAEASETFKAALAERAISAGRNHPRYEQLVNYIKFCNNAPQEMESRRITANAQTSAAIGPEVPNAKEDEPSTEKTKSKKEKTNEKELKKLPKKIRKTPKKLPPSLVSSIQMNMSK